MCLNIHTKIAKIFNSSIAKLIDSVDNIHTKIAKIFNSSIAKLIDSVDSVQSHLSNDVLLSRNFDEFTKYEQIQK